MTQQNGRLVFVSHSGEDMWVAKQIAREISTRGAEPFLDEADVEVGAEFEEDIRDFLDRADELLVLVTPWSLDRPYIWAEIGAAWSPNRVAMFSRRAESRSWTRSSTDPA